MQGNYTSGTAYNHLHQHRCGTTPLINKNTKSTRGDGSCFIISALYELIRTGGQPPNQAFTLDDFYKPYKFNDPLPTYIRNLYCEYFNRIENGTGHANGLECVHDTGYEAPIISNMSPFMQEQLNKGIIVRICTQKDNKITHSYDMTCENTDGAIIVFSITGSSHVVVPERITYLSDQLAKELAQKNNGVILSQIKKVLPIQENLAPSKAEIQKATQLQREFDEKKRCKNANCQIFAKRILQA